MSLRKNFRSKGRVPLERAFSKLGIASRTQARAWILDGKVSVNGVLRRDPSFLVTPETAKLTVDGTAPVVHERVVFLLNKPRGIVTTRSDEKGRPTVFSLLKEQRGHLCAVGRLDFATSGLLLLTNDTRFSDWLTDPAQGIPRTYLVSVRGKVTEAEVGRLVAGLVLDGERLQASEVLLRKASGKESHVTVRLSEGKNREIRRMFASLGHEVTRLKRVAYGGLELGELQPGEYRVVSEEELRAAFPTYFGAGFVG